MPVNKLPILDLQSRAEPGRQLPRSGEPTRTGSAASAGGEGGELTLDLVRLAVWTLQTSVGVLHPA